MSFPIPDPYKWDESFAVFYEQLDEEHKGLFQGVFNVAANPGDGGALKTLVDKVVAHFTYEESQMKAKNYSDFATHKGLHEEFVGKIKALSAPVSADTVNFAKNWLVQHIKTTDFKYKGKL